MIDDRWVILGAILNLLGQAGYTVGTVKGNVKPNRVTWFLWTLIGFITFFAQLAEGVGLMALLTFSAGFGPLVIFIASFFNKKSVWQISRLDIFCAVLSVGGVFMWLLTKNANTAILFSIIADFCASFPTLVKSYKFPETENDLAYLTAVFSSIITLLAIKYWNFAYAAFPLYLLIMCTTLTVLIRFRLGKRFSAIIRQ